MAKSRRMRHRRSRSRSRKGGDDTSSEVDSGMDSGMGSGMDSGMGSGMSSVGGKRYLKKSHRRGRRGGDGAADWIISNFGGTTEGQFMNTFGNSGNGYAGNLIPTLTGAPAVLPNNVPQGSLAQYAAPVQGGGKRRRKKGGYWSQVLETALVPFGLLGLQNAYGKRTRKHRK